MAVLAGPGPLLDFTYVTVWPPWTRAWHFLLLEGATLLAGVLTFLHARAAWRRGDGTALFAWVCIVLYGTSLEILSYNAFPNFTHGQFTVMFYHRKLPLYVTAVYPVLIYTSMRTVMRLGLPRFAEPLVIGLTIVAMDFPFDVLGPDAGWWKWDPNDPDVHYRWHGVPVSSYYWHLTWGAIVCALSRAVGERLGPRPGAGRARIAARFALAVPITIATMTLGRAAFLPFDLLVPRGVPDGAIVLVAFAVCVALLAFCPRDIAARARRDELLAAIPVVFSGALLVVAAAFTLRHDRSDPLGKLGVIALATAYAVFLRRAAHPAPRLAPARP